MVILVNKLLERQVHVELVRIGRLITLLQIQDGLRSDLEVLLVKGKHKNVRITLTKDFISKMFNMTYHHPSENNDWGADIKMKAENHANTKFITDKLRRYTSSFKPASILLSFDGILQLGTDKNYAHSVLCDRQKLACKDTN